MKTYQNQTLGTLGKIILPIKVESIFIYFSIFSDALKDFNKPLPTYQPPKSVLPDSFENSDKDCLLNLLQNDDSMLNMVDNFQGALEEMAKGDPTLFEEFRKFQEQNGV